MSLPFTIWDGDLIGVDFSCPSCGKGMAFGEWTDGELSGIFTIECIQCSALIQLSVYTQVVVRVLK